VHIKNIRITDYRNYDKEKIDLNENINIFYGKNGQGKTNILEAVFLCATARSHRTGKDIELVKIDKSEYVVEVSIQRTGIEKNIEIVYKKNERKKISVNEILVKKIGDLMGILNVVMFSPEDLLIIKEGPAERRRFMDILISQIKPSYFYNLQKYAKILTQRNNVLKNLSKKDKYIELLEVWDKNLIKTGTEIMIKRKEYSERLSEKAKSRHGILTDGKEKLIFKYNPSVKIQKDWNKEDIENEMEKRIKAIRKREIENGQTMTGPQRDDFEIEINEMSSKIYGSQGQQRTGILAIKLAQIDIMNEETGENPVLLLDDVMSELDSDRQNYILKNLDEIQTLITCTTKENIKIDESKNRKYFYVKNGKIMIE
jgi:DNA replication and repair protein RecF